MAFRDVAAKETSGLIARLIAGRSEGARKQIQDLRAALETALAATEAGLDTQPRIEPEIARLVEHLSDAAAAAAQQAAARVAEDAHKTIEALRAEAADNANHIAALTGSLEDAQGQASALHAELAARRAELQAERTKLDAEKKQTEAARRELSDARNAQKQLDAARRKAETAREEEARARASADAEVGKLQEAFDAARGELSKAGTQLDAAIAERKKVQETLTAAQARAQAADAEAGAATSRFKASAARVKELERAQETHDRIVHHLQAKVNAHAAALEDELASTLSVLDELLGAFEALAAAATPGDVLTTLIEQLAGEFGRVALFRVNGNRLEGEHQIGFDLPHDIAKLVMPLGMDSLLTRAAGSGQVIRLAGSELRDQSRAPFAGTPTSALALPIVVNDDTLAVIYADDSGQVESDRPSIARERSARFADALRQHAVALLTRMTMELKALAELRGYAQSLLDEAQQMYDADVAAGQKGPALRTRLENNLEFARTLYASRVVGEGPEAAALFDEQITAMIETPDTPFSRDLAAVLQRDDATSSKRSKLGA